MPYIAGTGEDAKCVYKKTKAGNRGSKVGCTKGDVKQYLRALYSADKKSAKDELAEIIEAFEVGKNIEARRYSGLDVPWQPGSFSCQTVLPQSRTSRMEYTSLAL